MSHELIEDVAQAMRGGLAVGFATAGLFFARFWRETRDRLFGLFALAFVTLAVSQIGLVLARDPEGRDPLYWVRLCGFAVILYAIWDKNRSRGPAKP